jgi:hypothetical protein
MIEAARNWGVSIGTSFVPWMGAGGGPTDTATHASCQRTVSQ